MADSAAKPIKHQEWGQSWQGKHYIKPSYYECCEEDKISSKNISWIDKQPQLSFIFAREREFFPNLELKISS